MSASGPVICTFCGDYSHMEDMCFSMKMASKAAKKHQLKWQQRKKKKVNTLVAKVV